MGGLAKKSEMTRPRERYKWWAQMAWREFTPESWAKARTIRLLETVADGLPDDVQDRLDYYATRKTSYGYRAPLRFGSLSWGTQEMYYLDLMRIAKGFGIHFYLNVDFGVVTDIPPVATLLRSRPVAGDPDRSLLMPFNRFRHFYFPKDPYSWEDKAPGIAWRGRANGQPPRIALLNGYHDNPAHDIGHIREDDPFPGYKGFLSVHDHLKYRYIPGFECINEATNLKWLLNSNSVAICHDMRFEGWFMEGRLQPDVHFIHVRRDLADLDEKLAWYDAHPEEAQAIVRNANAWAQQFQDEDREDLIATLVMLRYAKLTMNDVPGHLAPYLDLV